MGSKIEVYWASGNVHKSVYAGDSFAAALFCFLKARMGKPKGNVLYFVDRSKLVSKEK